MIIDKPSKQPPGRVIQGKPRVALALGGGAFHGSAHVGVLKALEENQVPIDLIAGTSAGSLVGALYCDNPDAESLIPLAVGTRSYMVFDFSLIRVREGFVSGKKLFNFINEHCEVCNIEDTKIPFIVIATDLLEGKTVPLSSGPIAPSVLASCAIPLIFQPVKMYGMTLADGGILDNIPADICRTYDPQVVIAVDTMADIDNMESIDNFFKIFYKSLLLSIGALKKEKLAYADVVISPNLKDMPFLSAKKNRQALDSGYRAAMEKMPHIMDIMKTKGIM